MPNRAAMARTPFGTGLGEVLVTFSGQGACLRCSDSGETAALVPADNLAPDKWQASACSGDQIPSFYPAGSS